VHPAPNSEGRPSFTSVVGNVDTAASKYIATTRVQTSRQEMIDDLDDMCQVCVWAKTMSLVLNNNAAYFSDVWQVSDKYGEEITFSQTYHFLSWWVLTSIPRVGLEFILFFGRWCIRRPVQASPR
jgi:hypothetical protein